MLTDVFGVSSSDVFAKNGGHVVFGQGFKTRFKQLQNLLSAFKTWFLGPVYTNTFSSKTISFSMKTQQLYCIYTSFSYRFHIVFSRLHENDKKD